jgi:hypothetical protein
MKPTLLSHSENDFLFAGVRGTNDMEFSGERSESAATTD